MILPERRMAYYLWRRRVLRKKMGRVKTPGEKGWGRKHSERYTDLSKAFTAAGEQWYKAWEASKEKEANRKQGANERTNAS